MPPQTPHERLDAYMSSRIAELDLSWEDLADAAGLHYETIRAIRTGDSRGRPKTRRAISLALRWTPGSVDSILAGGDPQPASGDGVPATEEAERQAVIAGVRALYPGDTVAEAIMSQWHKSLDVRQRELDKWRAQAGEARALHPDGHEPDTISKIR